MHKKLSKQLNVQGTRCSVQVEEVVNNIMNMNKYAGVTYV